MERRFNRVAKQQFSDQLYGFIVHGVSWGKKIQTHLTITHEELRDWLQSHFREGMTWDNYEGAWEIMHLAPFHLFNYGLSRDLDVYLSHFNLFPVFKADRGRWDLRLSMSILEGYEANEMTLKISERIVKELEEMNKYIPGYDESEFTLL